MELGIIIGVRPHYVKAKGLESLFKGTDIHPVFIDVHQHYDDHLRGQYINELNIPPIINSHIEKNEASYHDFTRQIDDITDFLLSGIGRSINAIMVLGDATPAMAGAIATNRLGIKSIHLEAGARRITSELEHWNSLIADHLCGIRYCYTKKGVENLLKEGLKDNTYLVGDVLANWVLDLANSISKNSYDIDNYCLVSIHRPQNCNEQTVIELCKALKTINKKIIWILHPRIKPYYEIIKMHLNVDIILPQNHVTALGLLKFADLIVTDSGGFVREGVLLSKRVIVCHEKGLWEDLSDNHFVEKTEMKCENIVNAIYNSLLIDVEGGKKAFLVDNGIELFLKTLHLFLLS